MCVNYIHYYPLVDLEVCKSSVMTESLYDFFRFLRQYDVLSLISTRLLAAELTTHTGIKVLTNNATATQYW